jgi:membrane protein YqaA with SNARE-associated domain
VAVVTLGVFYREETLLWSLRFVETLGGPGILLGLLIPDAVPIPLPHDAFLTFGLLGGLGFWTTVAWGGVGSIGGGIVGFFIGRWLATTRPYRFLMEGIGARSHDIVERYGIIGLGLSAVTPLPFGACCWAVGALGMRFPVFLLVVQVRWLRVVGHLWLIEAGFLGTS